MRKCIEVYTRKNCMQCNFTKKWLDDRGIKYHPIDIEQRPAQADKLKELGYQTVPVVVVHGEPVTSWFGFRPDILEEVLG